MTGVQTCALPISPLQAATLEPTTAVPAPVTRRSVWLDPESGWVDTPVYEGWHLRPGQSLEGPAVVDEVTTTVLVGHGDRLLVDAAGNFVIELLHAGGTADKV